MQEDMKTPLILGRSFLSTTNAHIDLEPDKLNLTLMEKKNGLLSSQDWNNALIWSVTRSKYQGLHLQDWKIHLKIKPEWRILVRRTQNHKPLPGGNSVVIYIYFLHCIGIFTF
jgi:hypothetical protein